MNKILGAVKFYIDVFLYNKRSRKYGTFLNVIHNEDKIK